VETPIGRCSLCSGTVVKETGSWLGTQPPVARCTSCGASEAPPDRVIPMQKQDTKASLQAQLLEAARQYNQRAAVDAISKQFLPPAKPCPHCGPIPMGQFGKTYTC
jgi:hypothetical protein